MLGIAVKGRATKALPEQLGGVKAQALVDIALRLQLFLWLQIRGRGAEAFQIGAQMGMDELLVIKILQHALGGKIQIRCV